MGCAVHDRDVGDPGTDVVTGLIGVGRDGDAGDPRGRFSKRSRELAATSRRPPQPLPDAGRSAPQHGVASTLALGALGIQTSH